MSKSNYTNQGIIKSKRLSVNLVSREMLPKADYVAHGAAPEKANEIATTDLALKALGVEPEIGAEVPLEFELRGKTYHYDMVLSGWWRCDCRCLPQIERPGRVAEGANGELCEGYLCTLY